jgi:hypothetical protein
VLSQLSKVPAAQAANPSGLSIFTVRPEANTRLRKTEEPVQMRKHILVHELHTIRVRTVTEGRSRSAGIKDGLSRTRACAEKISLAATSGMTLAFGVEEAKAPLIIIVGLPMLICRNAYPVIGRSGRLVRQLSTTRMPVVPIQIRLQPVN